LGRPAEIPCIWNDPSCLNTYVVELEEGRDPTEAWSHAVRVAGVAAVVTALVGIVLQHFAGVGAVPLLALSAAVALVVGLRLPPAAPAFLQPVEPSEAEADQMFDDVL
jgi:hypothetical protein